MITRFFARRRNPLFSMHGRQRPQGSAAIHRRCNAVPAARSRPRAMASMLHGAVSAGGPAHCRRRCDRARRPAVQLDHRAGEAVAIPRRDTCVRLGRSDRTPRSGARRSEHVPRGAARDRRKGLERGRSRRGAVQASIGPVRCWRPLTICPPPIVRSCVSGISRNIRSPKSPGSYTFRGPTWRYACIGRTNCCAAVSSGSSGIQCISARNSGAGRRTDVRGRHHGPLRATARLADSPAYSGSVPRPCRDRSGNASTARRS